MAQLSVHHEVALVVAGRVVAVTVGHESVRATS